MDGGGGTAQHCHNPPKENKKVLKENIAPHENKTHSSGDNIVHCPCGVNEVSTMYSTCMFMHYTCIYMCRMMV